MDMFEEVRYIYFITEIGLFESSTIIEGLEFASVELLNREVNDQAGLFRFIPNSNNLSEESPLSDYVDRGEGELFVVCKEGVFELDDDKYIYVGSASNQILTKESLVVPRDTFVYHDGDLQLIHRGEYDIINKEQVTLEGGVTHTLFEISITNEKRFVKEKVGKLINVKIPNYNGLFFERKADCLTIDYNERYKKSLS